jgi:hypothetical protein
MSNIIKGIAGVILVGTRRKFIPGTGWNTITSYECTSSGDANALGFAFASDGYEVDIEDRGPVFKVEVTTPTADPNQSEIPIDKWEVLPIDVDKHLFEHPKFQALSEDEQNKIRNWYRTQPESSGPAVTTSDAIDIYDLLRKGTDHYKSPATMVRFTRTVSDSYTTIGTTYNAASKIWTKAQLLALSPPALIASAISAADTALQTPPAGYYGGWLKSQPTITQRGVNKNDISQEWTLENWSTFIYAYA